MKRHLAAMSAASIALLLTAAPALACGGSQTLFEDDFSFGDSNWGNYEGTTFENGLMTIAVEAGRLYALQNQAGLYDDFDVCIDVYQRTEDPETGWASLMFWGVDYSNYYTLDVATNGYVKVSRYQNSRWLSPMEWTLTEGVVNAGEELNQLRVVAVGNVATVFVNGRQVGQIRGQPPEGGSLLGVYGQGSDNAPASFDFDNFKITTADADLGAPAASTPSTPGPQSKPKN